MQTIPVEQSKSRNKLNIYLKLTDFLSLLHNKRHFEMIEILENDCSDCLILEHVPYPNENVRPYA